jgi:hypothetical protein
MMPHVHVVEDRRTRSQRTNLSNTGEVARKVLRCQGQQRAPGRMVVRGGGGDGERRRR